MKNKIRADIKYLILLSLTVVACTGTKGAPAPIQQDQGVELTAKKIVEECSNPHKMLGIPPQPIPGIPVMLIRHAECLGHPNILIAWWPGPDSRVNVLYTEMIVEHYLAHLSTTGENFRPKLLKIEKVSENGAQDKDAKVSHMAIYKLQHTSKKEKK